MMRGGVAPSVKAVGVTNSYMAAPAFAARFLVGRRALEPRQCLARVVAPAKALGISQGFMAAPAALRLWLAQDEARTAACRGTGDCRCWPPHNDTPTRRYIEGCDTL